VDDGPSINPEDLKRVFEPLFTAKAVGVGLGLPLYRALVETNEGTLRVESRNGQGATSVIDLPAASDITPAPRTDPGPPKTGAAPKDGPETCSGCR